MNARELLNMTKKIFIDVQLLKNCNQSPQKDCKRSRKRLSFKSVMTPKSFTFQLKNRREGDTPTTFRHNPEAKTFSLNTVTKVCEEVEQGCQQEEEKKVVHSQMQVDSMADVGKKPEKKDASRKETSDETPKTEDGTSFEKDMEKGKSGKKINIKKIGIVKQKEKSVQFGDYFGQSPRTQRIYGVKSLPNKGRVEGQPSLIFGSPLQMKSKSLATIKASEAGHNSKNSIENTFSSDLTQRLRSPREVSISKKVKVIKGFPTEPSQRIDSIEEDLNIQANTYRDLLSKVESPRIKRDTKNEWIIKVYNNNKSKARC